MVDEFFERKEYVGLVAVRGRKRKPFYDSFMFCRYYDKGSTLCLEKSFVRGITSTQ